jgi:soluble lytic murein transglycosylase-like protein
MQYRADIIAAAKKYELDPVLVAAIVCAESAAFPKSARYEDGYPYVWQVKEFAKIHRISADTEKILQQTSWGLMHIMGGTARWIGFTGWLPDLCERQTGLEYGTRYLAMLSKKYPLREDAIHSYNWGSPAKRDGAYRNQKYVDTVLKFYREIGGLYV